MKSKKLLRYLRDFVVLPILVLSCVGIIFAGLGLLEYLWSSGMTGDLHSDAFLLLLVGTPLVLLVKFIWGKVEDINLTQHIEGLEDQRNS